MAVWLLFKHMEINLKWLFNTGCNSLEKSLSLLGNDFHIFNSSHLADDSALCSKDSYLILLLSSLQTSHHLYPLCLLFCLCFYLRPTPFPLYHRSLSHGSLSQGICSVMISFFCCITSSLFLKKKKRKIKTYLKTQSPRTISAIIQ